MALEAEHPDQRRDAVTRIAESRYVAGEDAFGVLDAVARTDSEAQVRCIAIRALNRYGDDRPVATMLAILQAEAGSGREALPPQDDVRLEAAAALAEFNRKGLVPEAAQPVAQGIFVKLAEHTSSRGTRIVALRALGGFQDRAVFNPLIQALHENDFALADTAERSLMALTGVTHDYNPDAWEQWLSAAGDPFARAGEKPVSTRPAGPGYWERERQKWKRAFRRR